MELKNRSGFAHFLTLSGLLGIAVAMAVFTYQAALRDPVLLGGGLVPPSWTTTIFTTLLGGSVVVLFYSTILDDVLHGWYDIVTGAAIIGQWGLPVGTYLSRESTLSGITGFAMIVSSFLGILVSIAIFGNYARRCWPKISNRNASRQSESDQD